MPARDSLEIGVKNFGPIVAAKVDLRPLTVFVGPSNTGKSYLAILIYALHRYFGGGGWPRRGRFSPELRMFQRDRDEKLPRETINSIVELAEQMLEDEGKSAADEGIVLPASVMDIIRSGLGDQGDYIGNEISRCFGINKLGELIRKGNAAGAGIDFRRRVPNDSALFEAKLTIGPQETEFKTTIPGRLPKPIDAGAMERLHRMAERMTRTDGPMAAHRDFLAWEMVEFLADAVLPRLVGPLHCPAFYLPADRTGVMHAHRVVVSALIENAATAGLRPAANLPMLSGVLADFLEQLIDIGNPRYRRGKPRSGLAEQIEEKILDGRVRVEGAELTGYPRFLYRPKGWKDDLPLMSASSMVSELAPVALYLRHLVGQGNVLIVEEPESHLHPAKQVEFTRRLAALVHAGIRVIVTTHSEWLLEELANIVSRSRLAGAEREGAGGKGIALRPDQVGAWLFKPKRRPKGSVVEEVKLDKETGLYPTDYDAVSEALYNESARIFNRIQDGSVG